MLNTIKDTTRHVYWNGRERCYVALMSECPTCRAEGATPAEALANVDRAYVRYEECDSEPRRARVSRDAGFVLV